MLKILQARLQQYVNWELPDVQARFRKGRGTRGQIANIHWSIEKVKEFQKNIYFCFIDYAKAFDCIQFSSVQSLSHVYSLRRSQQLWKVLKEIGISDYLPASYKTCMQVKKQQLELDLEQWTDSELGKVCEAYILYVNLLI